MSSPDEWYKRWGKMMPFGPWSYADMEAMMKEMEKEFLDFDIEKFVPKELVKEKRAPDGSVSREIGPIVHGYSMTVGPDGKPVIREFGNVKPGPTKEWKEAISDTREPLVDVVDGDKDVRVIVELPGARKEDIEVTAERGRLRVSAKAAGRKYFKELDLPPSLELNGKSTFNNGILEVAFRKRKAKRSGVRIKVD